MDCTACLLAGWSAGIVALVCVVGHGWLTRRAAEPPAGAVGALATEFPRVAAWRLASALVDAEGDLADAAAAMRATEEWRAAHPDFAGACHPPAVVERRGVVRDLDVRETRWNSQIGMNVTGRCVVVDLVAWHAAEDEVTVDHVARAALCSVERAVRDGLGVTLALRPSGNMLGPARQVLERVVVDMTRRYGGTLVAIWALPCGWALRALLSAAKLYVPGHTTVFVMSPDDVARGHVGGRPLTAGEAALVRGVLGGPQI